MKLKTSILSTLLLVSVAFASVQKFGNITVETTKDAFGDTKTFVKVDENKDNNLIFRCDEDGLSIYFVAADVLSLYNDEIKGKWKFDKYASSKTSYMTLSERRWSAFVPDSELTNFVKQANNSNKLTVNLLSDTYGEKMLTLSFDVTNFRKARKFLTCVK